MLVITVMMALACASRAAAQEVAPAPEPSAPLPQGQRHPPPPPPGDPLAGSLFPPEVIMQHQRELALTEDQKTFMRGEIQRTTTRFNELQWQLQDAMEALSDIVKGASVNEQLALQQLDKVLDGEREIKRLHMEMAIRIKNKLTPEQQLKLQGMGPGRPGGLGPGRPGGSGPGEPGGLGPGRRPGGPGPGQPGGLGLGQPGGPGPGLAPGAPSLGGPRRPGSSLVP
jgi:Spy/CpxP family protein refolding chaperone